MSDALGISDTELLDKLTSYHKPELPRQDNISSVRNFLEESAEGQDWLKSTRKYGIRKEYFEKEIAKYTKEWSMKRPLPQPINQKVPISKYKRTGIITKYTQENMPIIRAGIKNQMLGNILDAFGINFNKVINIKGIPEARLKQLEGIKDIWDVFGGSGFLSVLSSDLFKNATIKLNEKDNNIQLLWKTIKTNPEGVKSAIQLINTWISQPQTESKWWAKLKKKFGLSFESDTLFTAAHILKNIAGRQGVKISPDRVTKTIHAIDSYSKKLNQFNITQNDAKDILEDALNLTPEQAEKTLLFIDPPYLWTSGYKTGQEYAEPKEFIELLDTLKKLNEKGVKFVFFNSDPAVLFSRVLNEWRNHQALIDMSNKLNELSTTKNIQVIRMIEPTGVAQQKHIRNEMIITNMPKAKYRTKKLVELPWKNLTDYIKITPLGVEALTKEIAPAVVEPVITKPQIRHIAILSKLANFTTPEGKFSQQARKFFERIIGKKKLTTMTKEEGSFLIDQLHNYIRNNKEITTMIRQMKMSPGLLKAQIKFLFNKPSISELTPDEISQLNTHLGLYDNVTDAPAFHYIRYTSDWLGTWSSRPENKHLSPLYYLFKTLEVKMRDGKIWEIKKVTKFRQILKDMSTKDRQRIFQFMHRPKGISAKEFIEEREKFGLTDKEKSIATQLRDLWNTLFNESGLKSEKYWTIYQPIIFRYLANQDMKQLEIAFKKLPAKEVEMFYEKERIAEGNFILAGMEQITDPIELFEIYVRSLKRKKFLFPSIININKYIPMLPKEMQLIMMRLLDDELGYLTPDQKLADIRLEKIIKQAINITAFGQEKPAEFIDKWLNKFGLPTYGRVVDGLLSPIKALVYATYLGRIGSVLKNTSQEIHSMSEWRHWWFIGKIRSKTKKGRKATKEANIYTLGVPYYDAKKGYIQTVSELFTLLFRAKDRGSRSCALNCGIVATEHYLPQYWDKKITEKKLMRRLKFVLGTGAQQEHALMVIRNNPKAYEEPMITNVPQIIREQILLERKIGNDKIAQMIYLGYLAGEFSQGRTQFLYYKEETEKIYRGRVGGLAGTLGTWGPRYGVMLNRWAHGGWEGVKTLATYHLLWAIVMTVGAIAEINFAKWIGYQSLFRRIGEGFGTVFG